LIANRDVHLSDLSVSETEAGVAAGLDLAVGLIRRGQIRSAMNLVLEAYGVARKLANKPLIRRAMNTVAICMGAQGKFIEAVAEAMDAHDQSLAAGDRLEATHALTTIAGAGGMILDIDESGVPILRRCLAAALELRNVALEARVRAMLGLRLGSLRCFDEAEHQISIALRLSPLAGPLTPLSMLSINLAYLAILQLKAVQDSARGAKAQMAKERVQQALRMGQSENNPVVMGGARHLEGDIAHLLGDLPAALRAFDLAEESYADMPSAAYPRCRLLVARGETLCAQEDWLNAAVALEAAYDLAIFNRPSRDAGDVADRLAHLQLQLGDATQSRKWRSRAEEERLHYERESALVYTKLATLWNSV
jgi:tetratricopeptide (TPR) repeat protein